MEILVLEENKIAEEKWKELKRNIIAFFEGITSL